MTSAEKTMLCTESYNETRNIKKVFASLTTSMRGGEYQKMKKVRQLFPVPLDAFVVRCLVFLPLL